MSAHSVEDIKSESGRLRGTLLADNLPMQRLCRQRGFTLHFGSGGEVTAELAFAAAPRPA
jgi:hypothetical protein